MKYQHVFERKTSKGIVFTEGEIIDLVNCIDLSCLIVQQRSQESFNKAIQRLKDLQEKLTRVSFVRR